MMCSNLDYQPDKRSEEKIAHVFQRRDDGWTDGRMAHNLVASAAERAAAKYSDDR